MYYKREREGEKVREKVCERERKGERVKERENFMYYK